MDLPLDSISPWEKGKYMYKRVRREKDLPVGNNQQIYGDTDHMAAEPESEHL